MKIDHCLVCGAVPLVTETLCATCKTASEAGKWPTNWEECEVQLRDQVAWLHRALRELVAHIEAHGRIENHGHRHPDSTSCPDCRVLNAALRALGRTNG